jgi:hypothetical protein
MWEVTHDYRDKSTKLVAVRTLTCLLLFVCLLEIYCFKG